MTCSVTKVCDRCSKAISKNNYERHIRSCSGIMPASQVSLQILEHLKISDEVYRCCSYDMNAKGILVHYWRCHTTDGKVFDPNIGFALGIRAAANKGKPGKSHTASTRALLSTKTAGFKHSDKTKERLSELAYKRKLGGHTSKQQVQYRSRDGLVVHLQSSYELQVAQTLDAANIWWDRPNPLIWTDIDCTPHLYYPDFYLITYDVYLDPKNDYLIQKDATKIQAVMAQNTVKIVVLSKEQLTWNVISTLV